MDRWMFGAPRKLSFQMKHGMNTGILQNLDKIPSDSSYQNMMMYNTGKIMMFCLTYLHDVQRCAYYVLNTRMLSNFEHWHTMAYVLGRCQVSAFIAPLGIIMPALVPRRTSAAEHPFHCLWFCGFPLSQTVNALSFRW